MLFQYKHLCATRGSFTNLIGLEELGLKTVDLVLQLLVELAVVAVLGQDPVHLSPTAKSNTVQAQCDLKLPFGSR